MLDLYEELSAIVDTLESRELPYALCGGIAMSVHGFTRATEDIDLFIPPYTSEPSLARAPHHRRFTSRTDCFEALPVEQAGPRRH